MIVERLWVYVRSRLPYYLVPANLEGNECVLITMHSPWHAGCVATLSWWLSTVLIHFPRCQGPQLLRRGLEKTRRKNQLKGNTVSWLANLWYSKLYCLILSSGKVNIFTLWWRNYRGSYKFTLKLNLWSFECHQTFIKNYFRKGFVYVPIRIWQKW